MIQEFSAVCWLFGKELSNELKVRDRHISREGRWAISDDLGRSRAVSGDLGRSRTIFGWLRKTASATAVLSQQAPVGLISPYLKLSPPISPQVPVGLISSSWGGTQIQVWMPKAANEACHQGSWSGTTR